MSIANEVDEIIQKRNSRVEKLNMREEHIKDVFTALEKLQEQKKRVLDNSDKLRLEKDVLECIEQLDIQPYLRMWEKLQREFENLRKRFSRDSINIAVIGEARQGKSRLLQTISGLDDKVIPAFTTTDCTGATSTIKNVKGEALRAQITFRTEREMIDSVQAYLDVILGKDVKRIGSFQEIARLDLGEIEREVGRKPETAYLEHLKKYVEHFDEWSRDVVSGKTISITDAEEIKTYVAQHNGKGEGDKDREDYYKYLAVKKAEISCEFNCADAGKIVLQDTIGLGDTSLGIEGAMLDTVAKNSDAAIIIKRPEMGTGKFDSNDFELYQKLHNAFSEKNMGKWLFWLTNETKGEPYGNNHDRCESVRRKITNLKWELAGHDIVDVSNVEQVNEQFLPAVLSTLIRNIDAIDNGLVADLNSMADSLYCEYEKLQKKVEDILTNEVKSAINASSFIDERWYRFYNQTLMRKLKEYRNGWKRRSREECEEFKEYIENILEHAREMVPDVQELEWELQGGGDNGQADIYLYHLDKLRTDFTYQFLDIDERIFDRMMQDIKENIVDLFAEDDGGRLKYVRPIDETRSRTDWLSYALIDDIFAGEGYKQFQKAFQVLNEFKLTVRGFLMYKVRLRVERLNVQNAKLELSNADDVEMQAQEVWRLLDRKIKETCEELRAELAQAYIEPNQIFCSIVQEFYDRLCFSSAAGAGKIKAETLWKNLYREECGRVWGEEFKDVKEMSEIYSEWENLKAELSKYTKCDFAIDITNE